MLWKQWRKQEMKARNILAEISWSKKHSFHRVKQWKQTSVPLSLIPLSPPMCICGVSHIQLYQYPLTAHPVLLGLSGTFKNKQKKGSLILLQRGKGASNKQWIRKSVKERKMAAETSGKNQTYTWQGNLYQRWQNKRLYNRSAFKRQRNLATISILRSKSRSQGNGQWFPNYFARLFRVLYLFLTSQPTKQKLHYSGQRSERSWGLVVPVVQNLWSFAMIPKAAHCSEDVEMKMPLKLQLHNFNFRNNTDLFCGLKQFVILIHNIIVYPDAYKW